jgi:hypothetical protein
MTDSFLPSPEGNTIPSSEDTLVSESTTRLTESLALPIVVEDTTKEGVPWHLTDDIANEDWAMANLFRWINGGEDPVDPDFVRTPEMYKDAHENHGILFEHLDALDSVQSQAEWDSEVEHIKQEQQLTQDLAEYGWTGAGLRLATNFLDPAALGAGLLTGGIAYVGKAAQMANLARAFAYGGLTAAEVAALEVAVMSDKVTWGWEDSVASVLTAGVLGGAVGRYAYRPMKKKADDHGDAAVLDAANQAGITLSDKSKAALSPQGLDTAPAAWSGYVTMPFVHRFNWDNRLSLRFDMMSRIKTSKSQKMKGYFGGLAQDVLPDVKGGKVAKISATELGTQIHRSRKSVFNQIVASRNVFTKEAGLTVQNPIQRKRVHDQFYALVDKAVRRDGDDFIDSLPDLNAAQKSALKKARDAQRKSTRDMLQMMKDSGMEEAADIDFNHLYVPRRIIHSKINEWNRVFGEDGTVELIAQAYMKGTRSPLDIKEARALAKVYVQAIERLADGNVIDLGRLAARNIDEVVKYLRSAGVEEGSVLAAEQILKSRQTKGSATSARGRGVTKTVKSKAGSEKEISFRADVDETFETVAKGVDGQTHKFNMEDLYESNVMGYDQYLRQMSGRIAAAQRLGIKSSKDFDDRIAEIKSEAASMSPADRASVESDIKRATIMYRHLVGKSLREEETNVGRNFATRMLLGFNYNRVMGQVGFAQVAEMGNIASFFGLKAMLKQMPALRTLKRDLETGNIKDDVVMRELEAISGVGSEFFRFSTVSERYSGAAGEVLGQQFSPTQLKALSAMEGMKRVTSVVSGMTPITIWMQRTAAKAAVQRIHDLHKRGFKEVDYLNFREIGLSKQTADAIGDQLKRTSKVNSRGVVEEIGIEQWPSQLREDFANSLMRWTYRVIQENDIGSMGMFMTHNIGKILTQFRTFILVAHAKQMLHAVHRRNLQSFTAFMSTALMGSLAYMAQTGIKGMTADAIWGEEMYGEDGKWTLEAIASAAFQRSAYSALIPGLVDTGLQAAGFEPAFSYGRSTGLATGFLTGNPSYDTLQKFDYALSVPGTLNPYNDKEVNWEKLAKLGPWTNVVGIYNLIDQLHDDD